ncbi:MAG TPA: hypothetical protein VNL97_04815 [Solirubrobacterales bacterium]|nr:hypothetical protein [Solirubrobacterales bacterium]
MDLSPFGYAKRREAVVILGAGATRGASFESAAPVLKPPLDADFFLQLRASDLGHDDDAQRLLKFLDEEFGDIELSMEAFYSQVYLHDQFVGDFPRGKGRRRRYEWARRYFLRVIPPLFKLTLGAERCDWHDHLVSALRPGDTVVTFNYDCLIDYSLRDIAKRNWDSETGYGLDARGYLDAWRDHSGIGRFPVKQIKLLKLHGSMNWGTDAQGRLQLLATPYDSRSEDDLCIVPPLWQKSFDEPPFHDVWMAAREQLTSTKALMMIGYSLPLTDVYTQAMLRIDVQPLDFLLIANPDAEARERIRRVLRSAITTGTRVVEVEGMKEVGELLTPWAPG